MISIISNSNKIGYGIRHYVADTYEDLLVLNNKDEVMGTTAFIIDESKYYMLNSSKEWVLVNLYTVTGSGGSGSLPSYNPINESIIFN